MYPNPRPLARRGLQRDYCDVPDLNLPEAGLAVLLEVDVDGEMGVDVAHLVEEALGDADDHVVDEGADGAEGCDVLARAMVELDLDEILLGVGEGDCEMAQVLSELAARALDGDLAGLDVDLDYWGNVVSRCLVVYDIQNVIAAHRFAGA